VKRIDPKTLPGPDFGPLNFRAPIDHRTMSHIGMKGVNDPLTTAGHLLVHYGLEIHLAEYHGDLDADYIIKHRDKEGGTFGPGYPITADDLRAQLMGMYYGAAEFTKPIEETLDWLDPHELVPGKWPDNWSEMDSFRNNTGWLNNQHGIEVLMADCPTTISRGIEQGQNDTGPRRWYMVKINNRWAPGPMNDLQLSTFLTGLHIGAMDGHPFEWERESRWTRIKRRLELPLTRLAAHAKRADPTG
jgi:hypothetical protein